MLERARLYPEPAEDNGYFVDHVVALDQSLKHWSGGGLIEDARTPYELARRVYFAPFVVLSHGTEDEPLFNYANKLAQALFEMDWHTFIHTPSKASAEAPEQAARERLLARVQQQGFIDDYSGVRVSSSGTRFCINYATVWNVIDLGQAAGQAALFSMWDVLE